MNCFHQYGKLKIHNTPIRISRTASMWRNLISPMVFLVVLSSQNLNLKLLLNYYQSTLLSFDQFLYILNNVDIIIHYLFLQKWRKQISLIVPLAWSSLYCQYIYFSLRISLSTFCQSSLLFVECSCVLKHYDDRLNGI